MVYDIVNQAIQQVGGVGTLAVQAQMVFCNFPIYSDSFLQTFVFDNREAGAQKNA